VGSGGGDLERALLRLAATLRADIGRLVEHAVEQMRREVPELSVRDEDPELVELFKQGYRAQPAVVCDGLAAPRELRAADVPEAALAEVRRSARRGIRFGAILLGHRVGHRLLFAAALAWADEEVADPALREAVLGATSTWLFACFDFAAARMYEVHDAEREVLVRDRERRKRSRVRDLLHGRPVDAAALGYPLDGDHLGLVAWGRDPERALLSLGATTCYPVLTVARSDSTAWGWLAVPGLDADGMRAVAALVDRGLVRLAIGASGEGEHGFRQTHREALDTFRIARDGDARVTWYADVALLALTLHDREAARAFVLRELGSLAEPNSRNALLRETLSAYFATGQNATAAAAVLGVHDRTARYRIKAIEERLGRSILERRDELGVALRLAQVVLREDE
jgi:hypothetical protein